MWATLVLVGMLSLCASEGRARASDETGVTVLQVRNTRSRQRCSQQCKEALVPDGLSCNWSTVYRKRCLLAHCRSLPLCLRLKGGDAAELLAGFKDFTKRKKRDGWAVLYLKRRAANENDSMTTNGTVTSAAMPTTSPTTIFVKQATLVPLIETTSTTNGPLTATSTTPNSISSPSTKVTIKAPTHTTQPATLDIKTTLLTIQTATHSRETTLVTEPTVLSLHTTSNSSTLTMSLTPKTAYSTPASKVTTEATTETSALTLKSTDGTSSSTTKPSPPTSPQIFSVPSQPEPTVFITSTVKSATFRDADNSTVEIHLPTVIPNAINTYTTEPQSQTADLKTINTTQLAKNNSLINSTQDPLLVNIVTEATTALSEIISVVKNPKPTLLPTTTHKPTVPIKTEEPLIYTATPKEITTTTKTTLPTLQDTLITGSTNLTPQSSTSSSQNDVTSDKYLSATWPLARHLMDTSSLLAVLLFGIVFFLAVVYVFAAQAYESYKKKDYTQVDYLINGMYTDSEL